MFEAVELGHKVSKQTFKARVPHLREALLNAQGRLRRAGFPVIVVFGGVDGAGKGETANLLSEWMDPRWIVTRAYGDPTDEERERPENWRYWRDLPPRGHLGVFLSAWYSQPLVRRVYGGSVADFEERIDGILDFERMLAADGALVLKFWMHLGRKAQKKRFESLEADPHEAWRVTERDWKHWRLYDGFVTAAERLITRTSTGHAPWHLIDGASFRYRSLRFGELLLEGLTRRLDADAATILTRSPDPEPADIDVDEDDVPEAVELPEAELEPDEGDDVEPMTILSQLKMPEPLTTARYKDELRVLQARVSRLARSALHEKVSTLLVFEGPDAAGKGGAIRRVTAALQARNYRVISIAKPTDEELAHHYLWRFWRHLPRDGRVTIFDRSWYGRVLVERVEGFASEDEWRRAYAEINQFEEQLLAHGTVVLKFWIHITKDEQLRRFQSREETPYKRWKLTDEDWRNRARWTDYDVAAHDMIERTSTRGAPWTLVGGNDKRSSRITVLRTVAAALEEAVGAGDS